MIWCGEIVLAFLFAFIIILLIFVYWYVWRKKGTSPPPPPPPQPYKCTDPSTQTCTQDPSGTYADLASCQLSCSTCALPPVGILQSMCLWDSKLYRLPTDINTTNRKRSGRFMCNRLGNP